MVQGVLWRWGVSSMKGDKANFNVSQQALVSRKNPLMCIPAHKGEGQMMAVHLVLAWSEAVSILIGSCFSSLTGDVDSPWSS